MAPAASRPKRALVIGRFQPPHHGHLACIRQAAELVDEVIVVVGSAQRSHTLRDPFTAGERIEMLGVALADEGLTAAYVIPVPDLDQYHLWVAHVRAHVPAYDVVVTGSPMTQRLFEDAGDPVHRVAVVDRERWSGTEVRQRLFKDGSVADAVTPGVAAFLARPHLRDRLEAVQEAAEGSRG